MHSLSNLIKEYITKKLQAKESVLTLQEWLDSAAKRACRISLTTHILKFTHGNAKGTNINIQENTLKQAQAKQPYLSTSSLKEICEDTATSAADMDVAGLLQLNFENKTLIQFIKENDNSALRPLTEDDEQLKKWMDGLKKALDSFKEVSDKKVLSSDPLAKQVYFPIGKDSYHLLAPLYSTALSHSLYQKVSKDRFSEEAKNFDQNSINSTYVKRNIVKYPQLAVQQFGGTKPQNISFLNQQRRGKGYLLRSMPPTWKSINHPPLKENSFWHQLFHSEDFKSEFKEYQSFLLSVKDVATNEKIRKTSLEYRENLIDLLLNSAACIQALPGGWSQKSEISAAEKLWLDINNSDKTFQENRKAGDWMDVIAKQFATFICQKIKIEDFEFEDSEFQILKKQCFRAIKEVEK